MSDATKPTLPDKIAGLIVSAYLLICRWTMRIDYQFAELEGRDQTPGTGQLVVFWHEAALVLPIIKPKLVRALGAQQPAVFLSRSRDGNRLVPVLRRFGLKLLRGSSATCPGQEKGGTMALIEARHHLKAGNAVAIAVDGPRGPARKMKSGLKALQRHSGATIFPIELQWTTPFRASSWDRMFIPYPFAHLKVLVGPAIAANDVEALDQFAAEVTPQDKGEAA